jgi:hypothetical protein
LRVFGCLCYANTLLKNRNKFDPRAKPCIFLEYPHGIKGYKLYYSNIKSMFVSIDVIFHESIFPYAIKYHNSTSISIDLVIPLPIHDFVFLELVATSLHHVIPISTDSSQASLDVFPSTLNSNSDQISANMSFNSDFESPHLEIPYQQPRKSFRVKQKPDYLHDYHCHIVASTSKPTSVSPASSIPYDISSVLSYNKLSSNQKIFSLFVSVIVEPKSYKQALQSEEWCEAMDNEIKALELNNTWSVVDLPASKHAIGCKWVYKVKLESDGTLDYYETFSPVAKLTTVRTFLAVAAAKGWHLHQLDVNNAFLYGNLDEEVYMTLPPDFSKKWESRVCKINKITIWFKPSIQAVVCKILLCFNRV